MLIQHILFFFILIFSFSGCTEGKKTQSIFAMQEIEKENNNKISQDFINQKFSLHGKLEKIGNNTYFTTSVYKKDIFVIRKYYVTNDIYKKLQASWVQITGKYVKIVGSRIEIEIATYKKLSTWSGELKESIKSCNAWVSSHLPEYDLNNFKKTTRYQLAMPHLKGKNLNKSPYYSQKSKIVNYLDNNKMIIAINCGKSKLYESEIRGDFLSYFAIYSIKEKKLLHVYVVNTGYYLE